MEGWDGSVVVSLWGSGDVSGEGLKRLRMSPVKVKYVKFDRNCKRIPPRTCTVRTVHKTCSCNYARFSATRTCNGRRFCTKRGRRLINGTVRPFHGGIILTAGFRVNRLSGPSRAGLCQRMHQRLRSSVDELHASCVSLCCLRHVDRTIQLRSITAIVKQLVRRKLVHN